MTEWAENYKDMDMNWKKVLTKQHSSLCQKHVKFDSQTTGPICQKV